MPTVTRFIRHKNELEEMTYSKSIESQSISSEKSVTEELYEQEETRKVPQRKVELEEENVHYNSVAESLDNKQQSPFVVPFTDLPYPGEVDSVFDLKKFLKGDYCHENDLVTTATGQKNYIKAKVSDVSSYKYCSRHSRRQASNVSLDSENEMETKKQLRSDMIGGDESKHSKTRMWPTSEEQTSCVCDPGRSFLKDDGSSSSVERPSLLAHLYQDSSLEHAPTFKNQTLTEAKYTRISHLRRNPQLPVRGDPPIRSSIRITFLDQVLNLQHGRAVAHKISSDYVKTIDQIENEVDEITVGFTELKRYRPTLTVSEYQTKNRATKKLDAD